MNERIIDKIKKLLALADSDNENEAKLAMERASELLLRHNLALSDVTINRPEIGEEIIKEGFRVIPAEDKFLLSIIEKFFFVKSYYVKQRWLGVTQYKLKFIGEPMNIEVASYTYAYLFASYRHLWLKYKRSIGATEKSRQAYYAGLNHGITFQLQQKTNSVQTETGLVVVKDPRISAYLSNMNLKTSRASGYRSDQDASAAGALAGRELQIKRGLKAQKAQASGRYLT